MTNLFFSLSKKSNWQTPKPFFDYLNSIYNFKLDAFASEQNHLCENYFSSEKSAFENEWGGFGNAFCNPPYGSGLTSVCLERSLQQSEKHGIITVNLVPNATDTTFFEETCLKGEIVFLRGRIPFVDPDTGNPVPGNTKGSMLVIFGTGTAGFSHSDLREYYK